MTQFKVGDIVKSNALHCFGPDTVIHIDKIAKVLTCQKQNGEVYYAHHTIVEHYEKKA